MFECDLCVMKFKMKRYLYKHVKGHIAQKKYCSICGKLFKNRRTLVMHTRTIHSVEPSKDRHLEPPESCKRVRTIQFLDRDCGECGKRFPSVPKMLKHYDEFHTKEFACRSCGEKFTDLHDRDQHEFDLVHGLWHNGFYICIF